MHKAREWYISRRGIQLECLHDGCLYTPPEDTRPKVQRQAFRQHRIAMGEPVAPRVTRYTVAVDEGTAKYLSTQAAANEETVPAFIRSMILSRIQGGGDSS